MDYAAARKNMVARQLVARGISDPRVLDAMEEVPRHLFVEEYLRREAYDDNPLPIGDGQTISQPYMVAIMTQLLELTGDEKVLEIGTGSGYQAAVLSRLCRSVLTIERLSGLSERAQRTLHACGYHNVTFIIGDGTEGWPSEAPYDGIIVTAGAPEVPDTLVGQLGMYGKLIIPVGDRFSQQLRRVTRKPGSIAVENHTGCRFVDLVGRFGWSDV
jgi:protein-L-isoaspartate(D-aspartate) O-methyltransferase